ncbi:MAG: hypothetical protein KAY22_18615 [Rhizorhabdus sp.]|nr:hypothetical protein [Rhizorhabdus sp.]MBP8234313.1 hypothetical protein [Rhizorhabdus sp.]
MTKTAYVIETLPSAAGKAPAFVRPLLVVKCNDGGSVVRALSPAEPPR